MVKPAFRTKEMTTTTKRVFYNGQEMKTVDITFESANRETEDELHAYTQYTMKYPDDIDNENIEEVTGITQVKVFDNDDNHYVKVEWLNNDNEILVTRKIPVNWIMEIYIESKKCPSLKMVKSKLSNSERSKLK
jgi:hypothetical protein